MSLEETKDNKINGKRLGLILSALSFLLLLAILSPIIYTELKYQANSKPQDVEVVLDQRPLLEKEETKKVIAVDKDFSLIVPKIGANVKIIKNVDPFNSQEYQVALTQGVAHAKGSSTPKEGGNTFLFAHSSDNFVNANMYNSVFYLIKKLETDDVFYIVYEQKIYKYKITQVKTVEQENLEYMQANYGKNTAVLMTCWPPGTTLRRYVVVGEILQ